jgi:peptidoglycan/LPS O-acetylase OafA/YrhL
VFAAFQYRGEGWKVLSLPLTHMGLATYGIYLLHPIVWEVTKIAFGRVGVPSTPLLVIGTNLAVTLPLAWMLYQWYERPFIRWGKAIASRRSSSNLSAPGASA